MDVNILWMSFIDGISTWLAYFIGGVDDLIRALGIIMAIDFILGYMVTWFIQDADSRKAFKGFLKKAAMLLMVAAAVQLDNATDTGDFMRNAMILFLIGMEGISMIEKLGQLGIKVPRILQNTFSQLQNENEDKPKGSGNNSKNEGEH
ncbi:phage holin family protein [Solibacillus cecembensis]|uniref:phage holin family protein n=1 Tax=Solibacillus cecembensis TaxID=459347 RepID=UPI003D0504C6